jgi:hypothetical protein
MLAYLVLRDPGKEVQEDRSRNEGGGDEWHENKHQSGYLQEDRQSRRMRRCFLRSVARDESTRLEGHEGEEETEE